MPLSIERSDITRFEGAVIVNAANSGLQGGGGVDEAIHRAAGPALLQACRPLAPCPPGAVRVTPGFRLAADYVFHTVGPVWQGGEAGEPATLAACYRNCLDELAARGLTSIAFPGISTGVYGFPKDRAARIAVEECRAWLAHNRARIVLVAFDAALEAALQQSAAA